MQFRFSLFAVFILLAAFSADRVAVAAEVISVKGAYERAQKKEIVLVDVRSIDEWRETGIPQGAIPISIHHPGGMQGFVDTVRKAVDQDLNKPVALICRYGVRSTRAQWALEEAGFKKILNVREGLKGNVIDGSGWFDAKLPMVPYKR